MKKLSLLFSFLFAVLLSFSQGYDKKLDAVGLVVSDIKASEKFYTEILGFEKFTEFSLPDAWADQAGMSNGKGLTVNMYKLGEGQNAAALKLVEIKGISKKKFLSGIDVQSGVNYLTFRYEDFSEVRQKVDEAKIPIVGEVSGEGYKIFIIRDPDGIFVEVIESSRG